MRPAGGNIRAGAFSLVELLVVVTIISALTGLLVPTIQAARRRAQDLSCRMHVGRLLRALSLYAGGSGGWLPPGPVQRSYWTQDPDRGSPYEAFDAGRIAAPSLSSLDGWYGQGLLWRTGCVGQGEQYYCPLAGGSGGVTFARAWPDAFDARRNPADGTTRVFVNYAYRGGLTSQVGTPEGTVRAPQAGGATALVADNPCSGRMWHVGGYNVGFADGRVEFCAFQRPPVPRGDLRKLWIALDAWP
jgi:prepilin-type processing-associated H-X9-DG protein